MSATAEAAVLAASILEGSPRALPRGLTWIESGGDRAEALIEILYPHTRAAHVVGVTGASGAGKSTLVTALAKEARKRGIRVAILAVDPSSPYTGGAILGDRIRMHELSGDPGVFIRSMATRGALGGLSRAAADGVDLLCAAGFPLVIVETVGVGQDEVDIMRLAHSTIVVNVPGMGDDIQALKAGIMEIADIHVVNKADRDGAERTINELRALLAMQMIPEGAWEIPVVPTVATKSEGASKLLDELDAHFAHLKKSGELETRLRRIAEARVAKLAQELVADAIRHPLHGANDPILADLARVARRELSPHRCARTVLARTTESLAERGG
ncbi:MAG: methylmalonyl Co-A mutase-associated GTPase MeaB [Bryobacteraceae bacterium]